MTDQRRPLLEEHGIAARWRDEDFRVVWCEACGSEGYQSYTATVYEHGCGYGHDEVFLDYSRPCRACEGTGQAIIPVEPIDEEDLIEMAGATA